MNRHVTGNVAGLKPSQRQQLERTFLRRCPPGVLVSVELGRHLCQASAATGRQVGALVNRQGHVTHVFVGEAQRIYLPDVGRARAGLGHRRGLRHVHTVFGDGGLHRDDLTDLQKLRLDAVVALQVLGEGEAGAVDYAYLQLGAAGRAGAGSTTHAERAPNLHRLALDFTELLASLEQEEGRRDKSRAADERPHAMLVGVYPRREMSQVRLGELRELAQTAGVQVDDEVVQLRQQVDGKFVLGRGKLEETVLRCLDVGAELLIFDHDLSPAQARAIAALSELKVIDRTQLILDIFAQHAKSRDGKLQVELAQLKYNLSRLTDLDAGLSRLTGGIGGRGPGETKLEINRRRARDRITRLEQQIAQLSRQRGLRRRARQSGQTPIVSIVGYTNAGKSTLMVQLTRAEVLVADQLFATLDATSRRLRLPQATQVVLTDTVGFIRDLPAALVQAFRATLEELEGADLLLHLIDVSDPDHADKAAAVTKILNELELSTIPRLTVYNKADKIERFVAKSISEQADGVAVSAVTGEGIDALLAAIEARVAPLDVRALRAGPQQS